MNGVLDMVKNNKVAVITGAAQGIGRRTAEVLAERGYNVALGDLRSPAETMRAIAAHGVETMELVGDIADEAKVSEFVAAVGERWGHVDVLVNNGGHQHDCAGGEFIGGGVSARPGGQFGRAIPAEQGVRRDDARAAVRQHRKCGVGRGVGWSCGSRGL